jgi:anti-sigma regulatory factor (Ser/Thr protein kinase)
MRQIVFDFRESENAYPDSVLALICIADGWRSRGGTVSIALPEAPFLRQLFLNTNWAHFLDPGQAALDLEHPQHLSVRRYVTHPEQKAAVDAILGVAMRNMELRRDVGAALAWAINEITDNVLGHAQSATGGLVQVSTFRDQHLIKMVVADGGRGIPAAMRQAFPKVGADAEAVAFAMEAGITSKPEAGQGNGLAGSLRIATCSSGSLRILTGRAQFEVFKDVRTQRYRTRKNTERGVPEFPGTVVMIELRTDVEFEINDVLRLDGAAEGAAPFEVAAFVGADDVVLRVAAEPGGFGTRGAGADLRRKSLNLLSASRERHLIFDWDGVPLISSSFADEAIGKLFVELGPTTFASRISHVGTEPLVRSLLDRAVLQRVAQAMARADDESHTPARPRSVE